ncbi:MAG: Gfo/Idh/MocA family protein [Clostridium sp.]
MEKVRFGVIGIGNMGTSHSGWLVGNRIEGAELTAVCDIDEKRREWAKENLPGTVTVYDDYKKLLDIGIDAVIIAVPHYLSGNSGEALRNIHTMVEKPAGVYVSQIRKMNEEAEKPGLNLPGIRDQSFISEGKESWMREPLEIYAVSAGS